MIELFREWRWDIYHILAAAFIIVILWRVITLFFESKKINKNKKNGNKKKYPCRIGKSGLR